MKSVYPPCAACSLLIHEKRSLLNLEKGFACSTFNHDCVPLCLSFVTTWILLTPLLNCTHAVFTWQPMRQACARSAINSLVSFFVRCLEFFSQLYADGVNFNNLWFIQVLFNFFHRRLLLLFVLPYMTEVILKGYAILGCILATKNQKRVHFVQTLFHALKNLTVLY